MNNLRRKIIRVLRDIIQQTARENNFKETPEVRLAPMNLRVFRDWLEGLRLLYESGNISRTTFAKELGYVFEEEAFVRSEEADLILKLGITEFAPVPHSNEPGNDEDDSENTPKKGDSDESNGET